MKCRIIVELPPGDESNATRWQRSKLAHKSAVLRFIDGLIGEGYDHFVVCMLSPLDYWVAELLYYKKQTQNSFIYSLGLWKSEETMYEWLDAEPFQDLVLNGAASIFFMSRLWFEPAYSVKRLKISKK